MTFQHLFNKEFQKKLNAMSTQDALKITSVGGRRLLAIIDDLRVRVEYALLLPTINDFIQADLDIDDETKEYYAEMESHQQYLTEIMTTDGEPKPGKNDEFETEVYYVKEYARFLVRRMLETHEIFDKLIEERDQAVGGKPKIVQTILDIYQLEYQYFSKHRKEDMKRNRIKNEIEQMKQINLEHIDALKKKDAALQRERETKIRQKEDELDRVKKLLIQAKSGEVSIPDNADQDELISQEETLKNEFGNVKQSAYKAQTEHMSVENDKRRTLRKTEEDLQKLINSYDSEMNRLTTESAQAFKDMTDIEAKLKVVKEELSKVREKRAPYMNDERIYCARELHNTKTFQDMQAASLTLQFYIRKYLKTVPKRPAKGKKK